MCGRYIQVQKIEVIEKRFNVSVVPGAAHKPSYNVSPGNYAPVIASEAPDKIQFFRFGMTPFWAKKPMYLINARAEGDHNKDDNPGFKGSRGIISKPAFRKPIRSQRCLVIADAFIEGTIKEKLSKPYVVYLKERKRPFAFAGIFDTWVNQETREEVKSFSIITTTANALLQKLPHHRSPVILHEHEEKKWLDTSRPLLDITNMLKPFPAEMMNAYPIAPDIKKPGAEGAELIQPVGERIMPEYEVKSKIELELQGMGSGKRFSNN